MLRISFVLASVVVLALAVVMSAQEPAPNYPLLIATKPIPAGMIGERITQGYVSVEIGGGRTVDPYYLRGRAQYRWLSKGVAVVDVEPGQVLKREHVRPLRG